MKKILNLLLCGLIIINVTGCKNVDEKQNDEENLSTVSTIMMLTFENAILSSDTQYKHQEDYSELLENFFETEEIYNEVFEQYGLLIRPDVSSLNDKNTMYQVKLGCGLIEREDCKAAHNLYNSKLKEVIPDLYNLMVEIIDPAN